MTRFLLIRHACTDSLGKHLSGRAPGVFLNDEGRRQSQHLAQRLRHVQLAAIYSSPLERALQTAEPLSELLKLPVTISEDFLEIDFGKWTGVAFNDLAKEKEFNLFNSFRSFTPVPGGESMLEAQMRIIKGLQKLNSRHQQQTIAIISHSDLIKSAVAYYAGTPIDIFQRFEISPASVSVIEIYEETVRILRVNDTGEIKFPNNI